METYVTIEEDASALITLTFTNDEDDLAITPEKVEYAVYDKESEVKLKDKAEFIPTSSVYYLVILAAYNTIQNINKKFEVRVVPIKWYYTGNDGIARIGTRVIEYAVINQKFSV